MLAANDNGASRNLEIAIWKMLRAGISKQVILSTLGQCNGLEVHPLRRKSPYTVPNWPHHSE